MKTLKLNLFALPLLFVMVFSFLAPMSAKAGSFPAGTLDSVDNSQCKISGWAKDPDTTAAIQVQIFKDGPYWSGTYVTSITADQLKSDLTYSDKNHGFVYKLPTTSGLYDNKDHPLYLYAIDATGYSNVD